MFCCENCKETHEAFTKRAQQLDGMSKTSTKMAKLQIMLRKLVILIVLLALAAAGLTYFGVDVPVVGSFFQNLMGK